MDELPVGRYGTIHYMSNNGSDVPLASYPVDEEVINLGRSDHNTCHIRLIDRWCSDIHCKLIFEEGKAFLVVLGQNGVVIDGSDFFPSGNESSPTAVPLTNGSEWLIFKRRFIFQYPPKAERTKLLATPRPKSRKSLRMSMINAAHVWTPSVPRTQEESLRALRAPVSPFAGEDDGVKVTLVEGNPLHFAQNEEEIVVMENVDAPQSESVAPPTAPTASPTKVPQTPGRRGPPSLHRQVLLMNSHRKHVKHVDEQEEREVEASVMLEEDSDEELEEDAASNPFLTKGRKQDAQAEQEKSLGSISSGNSLDAKSFRASLGAIGSVLPFGRPSGGVVHSPHQREKVSDVGAIPSTEPDEEADVSDKRPHTPSNKRTLGSFLTPQATRGDSRTLPRQSMGGNSLHYMDVENDLEQARRRLAELGPMGRPQVVKIPAEDDETSKPRPVPRSTKKPRHSLADIPELSSPLPSSKSRIGTSSMTPIPEPTSVESHGDDEDGDIDSAVRLQRLMRTVEHVARRESIRESRRGVADPVDFYSTRTDAMSPTKLTTEADASKTNLPPSTIEGNASKNGRSDDTDHMVVDEQEGSPQVDTAHNEASSTAESRPTKKGAKGGKASTKQAKSKVTEVKMEVDEPAPMTGTVAGTSVEDVEMEDVPKKKPRATRKVVKEVSAPSTRARGGKTVAKRSASRDDTTDDQLSSTAMEPEAATTSSRRVRRPKATVVSKDQDDVSSTGSKSTTSRTTRKPKATKAEVDAAESIQENGDNELDLISSDPPSRPSARRKGVPRTESTVDQSEESQEPPAKRAAARRAPTTRKVKVATTKMSSEPGMDNELDIPEPEPAPTKTRRTQKSVKESQEVEESVEAKPRRTTRTKR